MKSGSGSFQVRLARVCSLIIPCLPLTFSLAVGPAGHGWAEPVPQLELIWQMDAEGNVIHNTFAARRAQREVAIMQGEDLPRLDFPVSVIGLRRGFTLLFRNGMVDGGTSIPEIPDYSPPLVRSRDGTTFCHHRVREEYVGQLLHAGGPVFDTVIYDRGGEVLGIVKGVGPSGAMISPNGERLLASLSPGPPKFPRYPLRLYDRKGRLIRDLQVSARKAAFLEDSGFVAWASHLEPMSMDPRLCLYGADGSEIWSYDVVIEEGIFQPRELRSSPEGLVGFSYDAPGDTQAVETRLLIMNTQGVKLMHKAFPPKLSDGSHLRGMRFDFANDSGIVVALTYTRGDPPHRTSFVQLMRYRAAGDVNEPLWSSVVEPSEYLGPGMWRLPWFRVSGSEDACWLVLGKTPDGEEGRTRSDRPPGRSPAFAYAVIFCGAEGEVSAVSAVDLQTPDAVNISEDGRIILLTGFDGAILLAAP